MLDRQERLIHDESLELFARLLVMKRHLFVDPHSLLIWTSASQTDALVVDSSVLGVTCFA